MNGTACIGFVLGVMASGIFLMGYAHAAESQGGAVEQRHFDAYCAYFSMQPVQPEHSGCMSHNNGMLTVNAQTDCAQNTRPVSGKPRTRYTLRYVRP
jgi:hypothetical protein